MNYQSQKIYLYIIDVITIPILVCLVYCLFDLKMILLTIHVSFPLVSGHFRFKQHFHLKQHFH